ncbi:hypothetical protein ACA910_010965 [Epithemia clementina (nom. ined.)]
MIVVGANDELQRQVQRQPESTLSLRKAVAQIGFDATLGTQNVFVGTEFHKRLLKDTFYQDWNAFTRIATKQMNQAFQKELQLLDWFSTNLKKSNNDNDGDERNNDKRYIHVPDVFTLSRIVILRTILAVFCGTCFVEDRHVFLLKDFMTLQDKIEEATAAAAVLPRRLANWLVLRPTRNFRLQVQEKICIIIVQARARNNKSNKGKSSTSASGSVGFPQQNAKAADEETLPYYGPWLMEMDKHKMEVSVMAELIVGLVFAAHKNPAIGAAQSFCHLSEQEQQTTTNTSDTMQQWLWKQVRSEVKALEAARQATSSSPSSSWLTWDQVEEMTPTIRACVEETTRITAHSLGSLRYVCKELELKDEEGQIYTVFPGETITSSHYLYNVDPNLFPESQDQYRPDIAVQRLLQSSSSSSSSENENFSSLKENNTSNGTPPQTTTANMRRPLTFSGGTHKCPGERIAMVLMQYFLILLLEQDASAVGTMVPIDYGRATLAQRKGPVPIRVLRKTRAEKPTKQKQHL